MASTTNDCEYSPATAGSAGLKSSTSLPKTSDMVVMGENETLDSHVPLELQLEEVDMNDEDLDMLEWMVRKVIPIPQKYFWESPVNYDVSLKTKLWHRSVGAMGSMVRLTDRLGKPIVDNAKQSSGRFDYVTSTMTKEEWEESKQTVEERKNQQEELTSQRKMFVKKIKELDKDAVHTDDHV